MDPPIVLPNGAQVPAIPGKYRVVPPPELNEVVETRFLLEYDFPFLVVKEMATSQGSEKEKLLRKLVCGSDGIPKETSAMIKEATPSTSHHPVGLAGINASSFWISPTSMSARGLVCRTKTKTKHIFRTSHRL